MYTNIIKLARLLRGLTNVNTLSDTDQFVVSTGLGKPRTATWGTVKGNLPTGAVFAHCAFDGANSGTLIAGMNVASITRTDKGSLTSPSPLPTALVTTLPLPLLVTMTTLAQVPHLVVSVLWHTQQPRSASW